MFRELTWAALILFSVSLLGCGGGDDASDGTAVAPPPPPPASTNGENEAPVNGNGTDPQPNGNSGSGTGIAAEGALAAHAKALSIVRPDHFAIVKMDLEGARKAQLLQDLPANPEELAREFAGGGDIAQAAELLTGLDLIWVSVGPSSIELIGPEAPPVGGSAYARFTSEEALQEAVAGFGIGENVEATHSGVKYMRPETPGAGPVFFSDGVELFAATDEPSIHQIIDAQGKLTDAPLLAKLKDANLDTHLLVAGSLGPMREPVSAMLAEGIKQLNEAGLPLAATSAELPAQIEFGTIAMHLEGDTLIDIDLDMDKPANAEVMKATLDGLLSLGKIMLAQQGADLSEDPATQAIMGIVMNALNGIKIEQADVHIDVSLAKIEGLDKLPEILAAAQGAAKEVQSLNNGKMLALAALNYHDTYRKFPANLNNDDGEEVLSWRVALLPFLEEATLYDSIDLQQPWDSKANAEWSDAVISTYQTPATEAPQTTTWKMVPDMPGGILFIEAGVGTATHWAEPDQFKLDPADLVVTLGEEPEGGYVVAHRDGSVKRMSAAQIKAIAQGEGGEEPAITEPEPDPAGPVVRTWTTADGKNTVKAMFVKLVGDQVTIKRSDTGKEVSLPVNILSEADQAYLKSLSQ